MPVQTFLTSVQKTIIKIKTLCIVCNVIFVFVAGYTVSSEVLSDPSCTLRGEFCETFLDGKQLLWKNSWGNFEKNSPYIRAEALKKLSSLFDSWADASMEKKYYIFLKQNWRTYFTIRFAFEFYVDLFHSFEQCPLPIVPTCKECCL